MTQRTETAAQPQSAAPALRLARIRQLSFVVVVLVIAEYLMGMYVNIYVTVPAADHGKGLGGAMANGPAMITAHAVFGMLLALGAIGVLVRAILARRPAVITASAIGLLALAGAVGSGASFTSSGHEGDSMVMAVLTGVALICYAANMLLPRQQS